MRTLSLRRLITLVAALSATRAVRAESWCAAPVYAHEWGVQLFEGAAGQRPRSPVALPSYFHTTAPSSPLLRVRVSDLPPDSGIRLLPVLHFFAPQPFAEPIPLAIGVGFTRGEASAWFPQVDVKRDAAEANSDVAQTLRTALERARTQLSTALPRPLLPDDPTRQLQWNHLSLTTKRIGTPAAAADDKSGWIGRARQIADALWVSREAETERFVFYEATTYERVALQLRRAPDWSATRHKYVLENPGADPVHDVVITHRVGNVTSIAEAPLVAAGQRVTIELRPGDPNVLRDRLRSRFLDTAQKSMPLDGDSRCTPRDPAQPFEKTKRHQLHADEVDLLFATWSPEMFARAGTTIVYREDIGTLDRVMPLQLFTDMYHYVVLRRLGLVVWRDVALP